MSKDFNSFLSTLDEDKITNSILGKTTVEFDLSNDGVQKYTDEVINLSFEMSLNLLKLYHEWLNS